MPVPPPTGHRREERLFLSITPGLEPALEREVRALGLGLWRAPGGVEVEGPRGLHMRLNLHLRTASRVLLRVATFPARDLPALERGLRAVDLAPFRAPGAPLEVSASTRASKLGHAGRIRDLAASVWRASAAKDAADDDEAGQTGVQVRLQDDVCTVSVDTSGALLYRRGYRQEVSRAPLRETLAAGMLLLAGYRGDEPLWDPMCGSGTIAIEAALLARRRAPGRERDFAFQAWPSFDAAAWAQLLDQAKAGERPEATAPLHATDLNAGALGTARRNARRAGVQDALHLERLDVRSPAKVPQQRHGLLVTNPPYGIRVGEAGDLPALYRALGALLKERLPGWRAAILAPDPKLERALGLEVADAFEVQNGGIRCRLLLIDPLPSAT